MQSLRHNEGLSLPSDLPQLDFAVEASSEDVVAVDRWTEAGDARRDQVAVAVGHCNAANLGSGSRGLDAMPLSYKVEQTARLRREGPDLAVGPARDDGLAVRHEVEAVAEGRLALVLLQSYPKQLLLVVDVPHDNLVLAADGKNLAETRREANASHRVRVSRHEARLRGQGLRPRNRVQGTPGGQCVNFLERVGQADHGTAMQLSFLVEDHCLLVDAADRARSRRHNQAAVKGQIDLVNASAEDFVDRAGALVAARVNEDFEDVARARAAV